jgi:Phasin protein
MSSALISAPPPRAHEDIAMAEDESLESLTATDEQTAEQIAKQTQGAMEYYFGWLQKTMSALPWSDTNLDRILLGYATQNVTVTFAFVRKLSQAKNFQDVVKIQTEFMNAQLNSFNDQAKIIGEIYAKAATAVAKTPSPSR